MSAAALSDMKHKTTSNLQVLFERAGLDKDKCLEQLLRILPCAEAHHQRQGSGVREAWARASVDFAELVHARDAVTVLLNFEPGEGDVERKLKDVAWQTTSDRAHMLGCTAEALVLAMQAPLPTDFCTSSRDVGGEKIVPTTDYLPSILRAYVNKFGAKRIRRAKKFVEVKTRRDAGVKRPLAEGDGSAGGTEAGFLRKRAACLDAICAASAEQQKKWLKDSNVPSPSQAAQDQLATEKFQQVRRKIDKVAERQQKRQAAQGVPKMKPKKNTSVWAPKKGDSLPPGLCLLAVEDEAALERQVRHLGFKPIALQANGIGREDFLQSAVRRKHTGHVVAVDSLRQPARFLGASAIACRLAGAFLASSSSILQHKGQGIQFTSNLNKPRLVYIDGEEHTQVSRVLEVASRLPGSKLELAASQRALMRKYVDYVAKFGEKAKPWLKMRAPWPCAKNSEQAQLLHRKCPHLFCDWSDFVTFLEGGIDRTAVCPGLK